MQGWQDSDNGGNIQAINPTMLAPGLDASRGWTGITEKGRNE